VSPEPAAPAEPDPQSPGGGANPVVVVTDSTTYVPREMIEGLDVREVSLYVGWEGEMKREDEYEDLGAFYSRLRDSERLPTTSQPSVGDFEACFEPILSAGHDIVSIHLASGISGTCDSAREAARLLADGPHPGRVEVIDAETGAGGLGCVVVAAATVAQRGAAIDEVVAAARHARETLDIWFCLDTLEYLRRGGRIGGAQALLGSALKIKPILTFGTEISPVGRVRTHSKALERMESYLVELQERGSTDWIVQHAQSPEDAESLVERGTEIFGTAPLFCTQVGPVLGAHLGSGMLVGGMTRGSRD
jgi:DegV family protein with EDD domain